MRLRDDTLCARTECTNPVPPRGNGPRFRYCSRECRLTMQHRRARKSPIYTHCQNPDCNAPIVQPEFGARKYCDSNCYPDRRRKYPRYAHCQNPDCGAPIKQPRCGIRRFCSRRCQCVMWNRKNARLGRVTREIYRQAAR